jgi:hypothetical protein
MSRRRLPNYLDDLFPELCLLIFTNLPSEALACYAACEFEWCNETFLAEVVHRQDERGRSGPMYTALVLCIRNNNIHLFIEISKTRPTHAFFSRPKPALISSLFCIALDSARVYFIQGLIDIIGVSVFDLLLGPCAITVPPLRGIALIPESITYQTPSAILESVDKLYTLIRCCPHLAAPLFCRANANVWLKLSGMDHRAELPDLFLKHFSEIERYNPPLIPYLFTNYPGLEEMVNRDKECRQARADYLAAVRETESSVL